MITVEFQPSGWSRGTYLNVGSTWLWCFQSHLSFDLGYRVEGFHELTGADAAEVCDRVASRAAKEIQAFRAKVKDVDSVAQELQDAPEVQLWPSYHAAVANALIGRLDEARRRFEILAFTDSDEPEVEWVGELRRRASFLRSLVGNPAAFSEEIKRTINHTRHALRFPEWDGEFPTRRVTL